MVSGANRVDEKLIEALVGEPLGKADAEFVRAYTGFAIGGVPPVGHTTQLQAFIDEDLLGFAQIWAAAGSPHAVFCLTPPELIALTNGQVVRLRAA
jgi:prolyl-tRNA editing enzyme YbaK/EbsC (Cys-tRNA(Pro) deacylase)